ncbi:DNA polymerase III subunit delta' [Chitinibacter fontanus]|uniref:DNA polymerase III subunit delta' n=1 Tax=Chitinibacter fontanus TaxID=1737446 RepID=A0A7D5VBQ1_9NEIS|nr:DNA polymerase III subunit delta' [Chitinibacter fontanus]QLI82838.1 DNA polymerase III subunit delta' [Chitinibacter fontanus]
MSVLRYPWLESPWQELIREHERLPHALLLTGATGIGKRALALHLAQFLLCEDANKSEHPCGICDACRWFSAGNHPDFRLLQPAEADDAADEAEGSKKNKKKSQVIGVEDVRELTDFVNLSAHRGGKRITIVAPAEAMNTSAANAFLKTLEEPPAGAVFILVSDHWRRLLPTIRSRCRVFPLSTPDAKVAMKWLSEQSIVNPALHLAHAGGAPLAAADDAAAEWLSLRTAFLEKLAEPATLNVLQAAAELEKAKLDTALIIDWLQKWVYDVISLGMIGVIRYYPDWRDALARVAPRAHLLLNIMTELNEAQRLAHHPLNQRLVLEGLLFGYLDALRGQDRRG